MKEMMSRKKPSNVILDTGNLGTSYKGNQDLGKIRKLLASKREEVPDDFGDSHVPAATEPTRADRNVRFMRDECPISQSCSDNDNHAEQ